MNPSQFKIGRWMLATTLLVLLHTAHAHATSSNWQIVDDFENYRTGTIADRDTRDNATDGVWDVNIYNNDFGGRIDAESGNQYIAWGRHRNITASHPRMYRRAIPTAQRPSGGETATYFVRLRVNTAMEVLPLSFGLADNSTGDAVGNYMVQLLLSQGSGADTITLSAFDGNGQGGGASSELAQLDLGVWYHLWIVAKSDRWDLYKSTAFYDATIDDRVVEGFGYRAAASSASMGRIMHVCDNVFVGGVSSQAHADDYLFAQGENLTMDQALAAAWAETWKVIDDFEGYPNGTVAQGRNDVTGGVWLVAAGNDFAWGIKEVAGNKVLGWARRDGNTAAGSGRSWARRALASEQRPVAGRQVTYFTRFMAQKPWGAGTFVANHTLHFGLGDNTTTVGFPQFMVQLVLGKGATASTVALSAVNGDGQGGGASSGTLAQLDVGTWYNLWIVAKPGSWDLYMNTGEQNARDGDLLVEGHGYRAATNATAIGRILHADQAVWADNTNSAGLSDDYLFLPFWKPSPPQGTVVFIR